MNKNDSVIVQPQMRWNEENGSVQITFCLGKNISKMITYESDEKVAHFIKDVPPGALIAFLENKNSEKGHHGYRIMLLADATTSDICIVWNGECEVEEERIKEAFFRKMILEYGSKKMLYK